MRGIRWAAPAKVNLRLRVMAREDSGYHQLETLFQALEFADEITVEPISSGIRLDVEGPDPCAYEQNLALRAAAAYLERTGIRQGVRVALTKRIPPGAGLGGGSSDAAAVLKALDQLFEGELGSERLPQLARQLGADVPFFLGPSPLALAWGRGDRMLPLPALPAAPLVLCLPDLEVSTSDAFRWLARERENDGGRPPVGALDPGALGTWSGIAEIAVNDFEAPVFHALPELARLKVRVGETGPEMCLLAGSGAAVFATYASDAEAARAEAELAASCSGIRLVRTATRERMPGPLG